MNPPQTIAEAISCLSAYDPHALPVAQVHEIIDRVIVPVEAIERVAIRSALGRVLAEDVVSPIDVPSSDNSAMDGYAVRAADLAGDQATSLRLAGTALAGQPFAGEAGAGDALRVTTGAVMPAGFDTVVMQEIVDLDGDRVIVPVAAALTSPPATNSRSGPGTPCGSQACVRSIAAPCRQS